VFIQNIAMLKPQVDSQIAANCDTRTNISHNLMETFVVTEVDQQLSRLPPKVRDFVSRVDIIAYALNRLPAMYATTVAGQERQQKKLSRISMTR
jgi:hypothetical protein